MILQRCCRAVSSARAKFCSKRGKSFRTEGQADQYSGWTSTISRAVVPALMGAWIRRGSRTLCSSTGGAVKDADADAGNDVLILCGISSNAKDDCCGQ